MLAAAAELGMHVHNKVPLKIKADLLQKLLRRKRKEFRAQIAQRRLARRVQKRQSQHISLDDIKTLMQADSHTAAKAPCRSCGGSRPPLRSATTTTTTAGPILRRRTFFTA